MITSIDQLKAWLAEGKYATARKGVDDITLSDDEGNVVTYYPGTHNAYVTLRVKPDEDTISNIQRYADQLEKRDLEDRLKEIQARLQTI